MADSLDPPGAGPADESIGALLSRVRLEQGKSQLRVAELLCAASGLATITRHEISRWEREERIPGTTWLRWLAVVLDCSLDELERAAAVARERRESTVTGMTTMTKVTDRTAGEGGAGPPAAAFGSGWSAAEREARRARLMDLRRMDDLVAGPELAGVVQRQLRAWLAAAPAVPDQVATRPRLELAAADPAEFPADRDRRRTRQDDRAGIRADHDGPSAPQDGQATSQAEDQRPSVTHDQAGSRAVRERLAWDGSSPVGSRADRERFALIAGLAQLAGWVAADAGASTAALSAFRLGLRAADRAGDRPLAGHLLGCLAQLTAEDGDPRAALRLARSAQRRAGSTAPSGVRSLLALRLAYAAAVAGLRRDCEEALAVAERAAAKRDARLEPDWLYWFDAAHFAALAGRCHAVLGRPGAARPLLESALRTRRLRYRAATITGSALAIACVDAGELEAAAKAATDALVACVQSGSVRAGRALQGVERHLVKAARASGATRGAGWSTVRDYLQLLDASRPYLPTVGAGAVPKRGGPRSADVRDRHPSTLQDAREEPRRAGGTGPV